MRESFSERHPVLTMIMGVLLVFGVVAGVWGVVVALSSPVGAGNVIIQDNSARNRVKAQEQFYVMYNGVKAADKNLDVLAATVKAHPNDRIAQISYDGAVQGCNNAVAMYNAETHKILSRNWLDPELPYEITRNDPETDCKESK